MNIFKKIAAGLLGALMIISAIPFTAIPTQAAAPEGPKTSGTHKPATPSMIHPNKINHPTPHNVTQKTHIKHLTPA